MWLLCHWKVGQNVAETKLKSSQIYYNTLPTTPHYLNSPNVFDAGLAAVPKYAKREVLIY